MDQSVSLGGSAPEPEPDTGMTGIDWAGKKAEASKAAKETAEYVKVYGKEAADYLKVHGKETASYLKTQGTAAAGAAAATTQRTKEEVVREWIKSAGLASIVYKSLMSSYWKLPAISLGVTVILLAAAIAILSSFAASAAGPYLILMVLALTLFNQIVHNYCDAALMLQVAQSKDSGVVAPLKETAKGVNDNWEPILGLSIATWAESVYTFTTAIIRGIVSLFQLPFRLCLQPFTIDRPVAAVDTNMQMAMALAMVAEEQKAARAAVDNAEVYMLQQVGPKPYYTRTLYGVLSVTALPTLIAGIVLACIGYLTAGFSLIFIPISLSQWAWNTCAHVLAFAHHRYSNTGKDDVILPAGMVNQIYQSTASAPSSLPPSSSPHPSIYPAVVGEEEEEEAKMEGGGFSTVRV